MLGQGLQEIVWIATAALLLGVLLQRFRQPAIVGYVAVGALLGPSGLGVIEDREQISTLAEFGILLLLFVVGMEVSLRSFKRIYHIAILATILQIGMSVAILLIAGQIFGWSAETALVIGFIIAISSTAVALTVLKTYHALRSDIGRLAIGILVAQDLAVVPILILIDGLSDEARSFLALGNALLAILVLALMIRYLTRRKKLQLPFGGFIADSKELTVLMALSYCFGAAFISGAMGLSAAFGAFLAGLWIGNSTLRRPVLEAALPLQNVLMMVFFLSIGLLLDIPFIWTHIGAIFGLLVLILAGKSIVNMAILRLLGEPGPRVWLSGLVLGQVGEFSLVIVGAGAVAGLLGPHMQQLLIAVIALSLMLSPLFVALSHRLGSNVILGNAWLFQPNLAANAQANRVFFSAQAPASNDPAPGRDILASPDPDRYGAAADNDNHFHNRVSYKRLRLVAHEQSQTESHSNDA